MAALILLGVLGVVAFVILTKRGPKSIPPAGLGWVDPLPKAGRASAAVSPRDLELDGVLINAIGRLDDVCPSCGVVLDRRPGRTSRCPHCAATIHVRHRIYDGRKVLMSPAESAICDRQNTAFYELKSLLRHAYDSPRIVRMVEDMGVLYAQTDFDWDLLEAYFTSTSTIHFQGIGPSWSRPAGD